MDERLCAESGGSGLTVIPCESSRRRGRRSSVRSFATTSGTTATKQQRVDSESGQAMVIVPAPCLL